MLALHLLQSALVHVNTLLLQAGLEASAFRDLVGEDRPARLSPLFWTHVNPYLDNFAVTPNVAPRLRRTRGRLDEHVACAWSRSVKTASSDEFGCSTTWGIRSRSCAGSWSISSTANSHRTPCALTATI